VDLENKYYIYLRSAVFLIIFLVLHYLFDFFPNIVIGLISGINESFYQHLKVAFYSYLILTLIEFIIYKSKISVRENFLYSHLLSSILVPWSIFILWFIGPALIGQFDNVVIEIIYANIITYLSILTITLLEQSYSKVDFTSGVKVVILILLIISIMEFTIFTFELPWHDMFVEP